MKWKLELDALIESTMAFAKDTSEANPLQTCRLPRGQPNKRSLTHRHRSRLPRPLRQRWSCQRHSATKSDSA
jgi:hypothetical protein